MLKSLHTEKNRLSRELDKVNSMISAFDGISSGRVGRRKGYKMTAAHRRAIKAGWAKRRAKNAQSKAKD